MKKIEYSELKQTVSKIFAKIHCFSKESNAIAEILSEADLRGITSHGVARVPRYINHIKTGIIEINKDPETILETPVSLVIDGNNGIGQYIATKSLEKTIEKAKTTGICLTTIRNSNHYGIAGYYAEKCAHENMIGISMTNTAPLVVPTFGKNMLLGTNPIAVAFPTQGKYPILIDMATSVVPRGKLEVHARNDQDIPLGWATDENGLPSDKPKNILNNMLKKSGGGLLPLGGEGEKYSGHKGFGLGLMVELFTSCLSMGHFSFETYRQKGGITHFFAAIDLNIFGNAEEIKSHTEELVKTIKQSELSQGSERIYIHGEKEYEKREAYLKNGIPLEETVYKNMIQYL